MFLSPGSRVGAYEIDSVIGSGGMGEVYRARDTRLDRIVALKILPADLAREGERVQRFEREARLTSSLNHPNIVVLYDIGASDGLNYIAMEHVEGETLLALMRDGALPVAMVTDLAAQIADGVASAHEAGVIHRDLKPSNIMITSERRAKVLDFGLGKLIEDAPSSGSTLTALRGIGTTPGVLLGTAAYMSPEQAQGRPADAQSDQFALGLIIYEMLTGRHAFSRASAVQTMTAIIEDEAPPIYELAPRTPEALAIVVQRCLAKDPVARFASTTDLARALQDIGDHLKSRRTLAPVAPPARARVRGLTAAAILLAAVGAIGWFASRTAPLEARHLAVLPFTNLNDDASDRALGDGLAEVLVARLTQLERFSGGLQVVPAVDVRQQQVASAADARRLFGVHLVVSGSLQRTADRIRLTLNVIDAQTLRQLRADTVEVATKDAAGLQDELLVRLARLLDIDMTEQARAVVSAGGTRAPGALEYYLQGRGYLQRYEKIENVDAALGLFERSVDLDPEYGLAHAALAEACWRKYDLTKDERWLNRAQAAGAAALRLSPSLAQVRVTLGMLAIGTGRYEEAITELNAALVQEPTSADAYRELGRAYEGLGDTTRAESTFKAAVAARPSRLVGLQRVGRLLFPPAPARRCCHPVRARRVAHARQRARLQQPGRRTCPAAGLDTSVRRAGEGRCAQSE